MTPGFVAEIRFTVGAVTDSLVVRVLGVASRLEAEVGIKGGSGSGSGGLVAIDVGPGLGAAGLAVGSGLAVVTGSGVIGVRPGVDGVGVEPDFGAVLFAVAVSSPTAG